MMAKATETGVVEEKVILDAGSCTVTILPQLGGKIASLRVNCCELLQTPLAAYAPRTRAMAFDESDASGWDECLPSVAGCTVETAFGPVAIPDHGDLWRVAWKLVNGNEQGSEDGTAILRGECFSLPLALERKVTLSQTTRGWRLSLDYTATNTGGYPVPWSWAAHSAFAAEAGDKVVLPDSIRNLRLEGSGGGRLGTGGAVVSWPIATLSNGSKTDLSVAQPAESGIGEKLFAGPLAATENWCVLERPAVGVRIKVSFDPTATPYLGLWICYGGWPERPGPKQTCVAIEPATAPVDSLAITGPWSRTLFPGQSYLWPMTVDIESR